MAGTTKSSFSCYRQVLGIYFFLVVNRSRFDQCHEGYLDEGRSLPEQPVRASLLVGLEEGDDCFRRLRPEIGDQSKN